MFGGWGCLGLDFFCSLYEGVVIKCQPWTTPLLLMEGGTGPFIIGRKTVDDISAIVAPRLSEERWFRAVITARRPRPKPVRT